MRRPRRSTLFPYTTLFRSGGQQRLAVAAAQGQGVVAVDASPVLNRALVEQRRLPQDLAVHPAGVERAPAGVDEDQVGRAGRLDQELVRPPRLEEHPSEHE